MFSDKQLVSDSPDVSPISTAVAANKRPAPSPPDVSSFPQPQPVAQPVSQSVSLEERRSLSSQYFDEKARREKPYGDDVTELRTVGIPTRGSGIRIIRTIVSI